MGTVWQAENPQDGHPLALKFLSAHADGSPESPSHDAYLRELRSVAALSHPGIVRLFDHGELGGALATGVAEREQLGAGTHWLAMELAQGGSLADHPKPIAWPVLYQIVRQILDALAHAHARGVVHTDLKPANVLVFSPPEAYPHVVIKLADFGIAHNMRSAAAQQRSQSVLGTPAYMAPEQFRGLPYLFGPWTDLYALGVLVHELATGRPPFEASETRALYHAHLHAPRPNLLELRPDIPGGFAQWSEALLRPSLASRLPSAAEALRLLIHEVGTEALSTIGDRPLTTLAALLPAPFQTAEAPRLDDTQPHQGTAPGPTSPEVALARVGPVDTLTLDPERTTRRAAVVDVPRAEQAADDAPGAAAHGEADFVSAPMPATWRSAEGAGPVGRVPAGLGLRLLGLRTTPLVGREAERDQLWRALCNTRQGAGLQVCLLEGEAGAGKSRLAQWLCERALELGIAHTFQAIHGTALGPEAGIEAMLRRDPLCAALVEDEPRSWWPPESDSLHLDTWEVASLRHALSPTPMRSDAPLRREELWRVIGRIMACVATRRPVLLWIDDVQWAPDALGFVLHLLHVHPSALLLVLLTRRRDDDTEHPIAASRLESVVAHRRCQRYDIAPLQRHEQSQLVRAMLPLEPELAAEVARRSGGNALYITQLLHAWVEGGTLTTSDRGFALRGADQDLPTTVEEVWLQALAELDRRTRGYGARELMRAATLGQDLRVQEWEALRDATGAADHSKLVSTALDLRLLRVGRAGWAFTHGLLREVLVSASRRAGHWPADNLAAARALEGLYQKGEHRGLAERLGGLYREAEAYERAAPLLLRGARDAEHASACDNALMLLRQAEEALDRSGRTSEEDAAPLRFALAALRAQVHLQTRNIDEAGQAAREALMWAARLDRPDARAEASTLIAHVLRCQGAHREAEARFREARAAATEAGGGVLLATALRGLAWVELLQGKLDEAHTHATSALSAFAAAQATRGEALALRTLGDVARNRGDHRRAMTYFERARDLHREQGNVVGISECTHGIAECLRLLEEYDQAEALYLETIALDHSYGCLDTSTQETNLCLLLISQGGYARAVALLEALRRRARRGEISMDEGYLCVILAAGYAGLGRWREVSAALVEGAALLADTAYVDVDLAMFSGLAGELAAAAGRRDEATLAWRFAYDHWRALGHDEAATTTLERLHSLAT